jgi:hypothetical protein
MSIRYQRHAEGLIRRACYLRLIFVATVSRANRASVTVRAPAIARSVAALSVAGIAPVTRNCTTPPSGVNSMVPPSERKR